MASPTRGGTVAVGVLRRDGDVVLVRQQGPDNPEAHWALPGGVVEPGELLIDALIREVREETGLEVLDPGRVAWVAQTQLDDPTWGGIWTAVAFDVAAWAGEPACNDPDGIVQVAEAVSIDKAIEVLGRLPLPLSAPSVSFLDGTTRPGSCWSFHAGAGFSDATLIRAGWAEP